MVIGIYYYASGLYTLLYTDETWVNVRHTPNKEWHTGDRKYQSGIPKGKGGRLIITDAGTEQGFIPGASRIFTSKKTVDYHAEMGGYYSVIISLCMKENIICMKSH